MSWTPERIDLAKQLWREGLSANQIALKISDRLKTFTRNAVIGKMHRIGESGRISGDRLVHLRAERARAPRRRRLAKPTMRTRLAEIQAEPLPLIEQAPLVTDIMALKQHHCRWPIGDPGRPGFGYCGHTQVPGFSYCAQHAAVAYVPVGHRQGRPYFNSGQLHRKLKAA